MMTSSLSRRLTRGLLGALLLAGILAVTPDANAHRASFSNTIVEASLDSARVAAEVSRILETTPYDMVLRESMQDLVAADLLTRREAAQFVRLTTSQNPQALQRGMNRLKQSDNEVLSSMASALEMSVESYTDAGRVTYLQGGGEADPSANDQASTSWSDGVKTIAAGVVAGAAIGTGFPGIGTGAGAVVGGVIAAGAVIADNYGEGAESGGDADEDGDEDAETSEDDLLTKDIPEGNS